MIINHKLKIDLVSQEVIPRLNAMQNDANSRVLEISLLESGMPWELPADVSAAVSYAKPDGTSGLYDTLPDGSTAYTISGNTVTIVLAPQVLTAPGLVRASIILIKNAVQLTTFPLSILVEAIPGAGSEKSEDYYHYTTFDALNRAIGNLADLETENKSSLVAAINEITHELEKGTVKTVNGLSPDENGNIEVEIDVDEAVNTALQQAKASGQFDGNDGHSIFLAHVTAGDATEITVNANDTITNGYSVKLGDLLLTSDGKVFAIKSFEMSFGPGGKKAFYYVAELFSDINGNDGASVGHSWNGTVLTVTSASGTSSADLKGAKGDTPVKGTDYWTDADKAEIVAGVTEALENNKIEVHPLEGGYYAIDGSIISEPVYIGLYTDMIPVSKGDKFKYTGFGAWGAASVLWYNESNAVVGYEQYGEWLNPATEVVVIVPDRVAYARFCSFDETGREVLEVSRIESDVTISVLAGKKIAYDGDSICYGSGYEGGYAKLIAEKVGGTYDNQAVGGAKLVTKGSNSWHSVVDNLPNLPTDADLYCFEGGINDYWTPSTLGTFDYSNFDGELDTTTVCGALETIFRYCLNNFVGKPVCFVITHKVQQIAYQDNTTGDSFKDYHDAMVGICEKYSIPYYDAFSKSGLNGWNAVHNQVFFKDGDGIHPNEEAYKRYYVPQLISLFESIMPEDVIQFAT